jgi:hypothetical protein
VLSLTYTYELPLGWEYLDREAVQRPLTFEVPKCSVREAVEALWLLPHVNVGRVLDQSKQDILEFASNNSQQRRPGLWLLDNVRQRNPVPLM